MEAKKEWQAQRKEDWQQMSAGLRYLEANQKSMVQDTARNSTYIQSLANNLRKSREASVAAVGDSDFQTSEGTTLL